MKVRNLADETKTHKQVIAQKWLPYKLWSQESSVPLEHSVGSQIVAHTQMETGDGPNKPNTINL